MASPSDCSMGARIAFAVLGIALGLIVCVVFWAVYDNVNAAIWGFVSGVAAAMTLFVHLTYRKRVYDADPAPLRSFMYCGCVVQLIGVCGLAVYIVLALYEHQGIVIYGPGYFLTAVWCFMTLKWGFQLFFFSRSYWRDLTGACKLLPPTENAVPAEDYGSKC